MPLKVGVWGEGRKGGEVRVSGSEAREIWPVEKRRDEACLSRGLGAGQPSESEPLGARSAWTGLCGIKSRKCSSLLQVEPGFETRFDV